MTKEEYKEMLRQQLRVLTEQQSNIKISSYEVIEISKMIREYSMRLYCLTQSCPYEDKF